MAVLYFYGKEAVRREKAEEIQACQVHGENLTLR